MKRKNIALSLQLIYFADEQFWLCYFPQILPSKMKTIFCSKSLKNETESSHSNIAVTWPYLLEGPWGQPFSLLT
jgi:hypothetical protein